MNLGLIFVLSGIALLALASSLFADDGSIQIYENALPDTSSGTPAYLENLTAFSLEEESKIRHAPFKSVLFSSVMPGLGQAQNGRWAKASAFVVVGSLLVTKIIVESQRADRYLHLARSGPDDVAEAYYDEYLTHFDRRDRFVWWTVGFWVYNLFDAYIDGHLFAFSRQ